MFKLNNKKTMYFLIGCIGCFIAVFTVLLITNQRKGRYDFQSVTVYESDSKFKSPSDLAVTEDGIFVSDATSNKLYKMNKSGDIISSYLFKSPVNAVYASGEYVYALVGELEGEVYRFNASLELQNRIEAEHTPSAALMIDNYLYVANRFSNCLTVYTDELEPVEHIELEEGREPNGLAFAQEKLFVSCHLPSGSALDENVSSNLIVVDPTENKVENTIPLINGTGSVKDITVSSNGEYLYLSCVFSKYAYPTSQLDKGWINTNGIAIIDAQAQEVYAGVLLDKSENGAANPWGIEVIGEGTEAKIVCAISGLGEIAIVDEDAMFERLSAVENGTAGGDLSEVVDQINFLSTCMERVKIGGQGLRQIQLVEEDNVRYVYMTQYFTGAIARYELDATEVNEDTLEQYILGEQDENTKERIGEILWYDANYCYQTWESCATCHPDARVDGFNWDNLNDGLGNPKQAKSMVYSHRTPPVMITGARPTAEIAVQKGMEFIQFNTMSVKYLNCIDSFLKSLTPTQSPYLNRDGSLTESAQNGKKLFEDLSCNTCHSGPNFTDMQLYQSDSSLATGDTWENRKFDTPSLVEVWRTGPWLFNGSAATMEEAIKIQLGDKASTLTAQQLKDLTNYVMSIGSEGQYYGVEQVFFDLKTSKDLSVNLLKPDTIMNRITIRKQWATDKKGFVTIKLFNNSNKQIGKSVYAVLRDMNVGDYAEYEFNLPIPSDLPLGSYYTITITNANNTSEHLATPFIVYYK